MAQGSIDGHIGRCVRPAVSVFGSNGARPGQKAYEVARAVGRTLGQLGYTVVNGGYGGTMEASARGAREAGGSTVGVTCRVWSSPPNEYIDEVIQTAGLTERIGTLIELGRSGYVVLPGATGTLAELAWVWELACKGLAPPRPIVCLGDFWRPLVALMASQRPACAEAVVFAGDPRELGRHFLRFPRASAPREH